MKRLSIFIYCYFLFSCTYILADEPDSIIFSKDLLFKSEFEEKAFATIKSLEGPNFNHLFMAICDSCTKDDFINMDRSIENRIRVYTNDSKFQKQSDKKKIKRIHSDIHELYLEKYEILQYFPDLFNTGKYNCVSASAFYGIIFTELGISFTIKQSFDHVFIITYPETSSIRVETTDPQRGYYAYDDRTKIMFADFLKESKLISESEYDEKTTDELFNEYFFKEENIDLLQLVGIQYYNKVVELLDEKKFKEAFVMAEKSYYLHSQDRTGFLLLITVANILNGCNYEDISYADYIYKAARYNKYGIKNDFIYDQFINVTQKVLISQYDTILYDEYYNRIIDNIEDTTLQDEISYIYNYERGRVLYNDNKFKSSLPFIERAYKIKPKHVDARKLFTGVVLMNFSNLSDPEKALNSLNEYAQNYPDLMNNNTFSELRCSLILGISVESFMSGMSQKAFDYIQSFEDIAESSDVNINSYPMKEVIVESYSRAASHYFKRGNYKAAKRYLVQGLKYVPNSYELKNKLRHVE